MSTCDPSRPAPGFGIYVHWPFCRSKCPYCDFNSHVRETIEQDRWRRALLAELAHYAAMAPGRQVTSVFFGGGTPSLMDPATVSDMVQSIRRHWLCGDDLEITLEANPTSLEAERFRAFAQAGVNRLSIGVQALDDDWLRYLGRQHSRAEALAAVALAREVFPRFSFDLIYARPGQELQDWLSELERALAEQPKHLSLYQLTIEPGTAFHSAWRRGELALPNQDDAAEVFKATRTRLAKAGLNAYEVSNHAATDETCRHNLTYWRYGDYLGVGPGAHGRLSLGQLSPNRRKMASRQHRAPEIWLRRVEAEGHATQIFEEVSPQDRLNELMLLGLRLGEGVARSTFERELGLQPEDLLPADRLRALELEGYIALDEKCLRTTEAGCQRLSAVLDYLLN